MECLHPINVSNPRALSGLLPGESSRLMVPCGRCIACRINKTREWQCRLIMESIMCHDMAFVTFTYDNQHLPDDQGLHKDDVQRFMKRLRKDLSKGRKVRYFCSGEYGDKFGRPHYHMILFGIHPILDKQLLYDNWKQGSIFVGSVTPQSCRYVSKYMQKKLTGEKSEAFYGGRQSPFSLASQGLGMSFVEKYKDVLREDKCFSFDGKKYPLPRMAKDRLFTRYERYLLSLDMQEHKKLTDWALYAPEEARLLAKINLYSDPSERVYKDYSRS